jgi:1,4-alpha-glucan branching enzyme
MRHEHGDKVNARTRALLEARLHDPFSMLGLHRRADAFSVRLYEPRADSAWLHDGARWAEMRAEEAGLFRWTGRTEPPMPYRVRVRIGAEVHTRHDAYAFRPAIAAEELYLFNEGRLLQAYRTLGAQYCERDGVRGYRFACWAPNAERVSVVGDFNAWDGRVHPMATHGSSGVWELFIPELVAGTLYKFEIRHRGDGRILLKSDPYGQAFEQRPGTASRVLPASRYAWEDAHWMQRRAAFDWAHAPISIYEVHAGSWRRHADGRFYTYAELAAEIVPYLVEMGYTHVELMPLTEHPLDESWGYQSTGFFAATSRFGTGDELRAFVDACHRAGVGVILDWVPGHFPRDDWALAHFDGTALYEHEDPRLGIHQDWGTHVFNFGRREVASFLLSSAHYWLHEFHVDGLRVDAVASMLYLDYSRRPGEWRPNVYGGRENLEAVEFLRSLNVMVHAEFPGAVTFAEESTSWTGVSRPVYLGGLGFSMKWNMGWMNDTLRYFARDPIHRSYHHDELTFGQLYAYSENFVLPLSHDEVVHGKGALVAKMPGDEWQRFANARLLISLQMTTPGKKLGFMGMELGQATEWSATGALDWELLKYPPHRGIQDMVKTLNSLYRRLPPLHDLDFSGAGFEWIDCHDAQQSVLCFERRARSGECVVVALNFTPAPRLGYRVGLPHRGSWREIFNSDSRFFGGSDCGNSGLIEACDLPWMGRSYSASMTLPPLAAIILQADARGIQAQDASR